MSISLTSLPPLNREWSHALLLHPFKEGAARINRAFNGVDFLTFIPRQLSWTQRAIDLIEGLVLMIPLVNTIVWIAMQTWGNAEFLTDPYIETEHEQGALEKGPIPLSIAQNVGREPPPAQPLNIQAPLPIQQPNAAEPLPLVDPVNQAEPLRVFTYTYLDRKGAYEEVSKWTIDEFATHIDVMKVSPSEVVTARYTPNWDIQEYHFRYQDSRGELHLKRESHDLQIRARTGNKWRNDKMRIPQNYPWIQQITLGLRHFALSNQNRFEFYILNPEDLELTRCVLEKKGWEETPGLGRTLKIEGRHPTWPLSMHLAADIRVDPQTGILRKLRFQPIPFGKITTTEWRQSDQ